MFIIDPVIFGKRLMQWNHLYIYEFLNHTYIAQVVLVVFE